MPYPLRSRICKQCGVAFKSIQKNPKFCTHEHYLTWLKNGHHPMLGKHHKQETLNKLRNASRNQKNRNLSGLLSKENRERNRQFCLAKKGIKNPRLSLAMTLNPNNVRDWIIRSPTGKIYEIRNLKKWCRENKRMFENEDFERFYKGITKLWVVSKYALPSQYKGWTAVHPHLSKI